MKISSDLSVNPQHAYFVATGELDAFSALDLRRHLADAVARECRSFTLDLARVTFTDAGGLSAVVRLKNDVRPRGGDVVIVAASPTFRRVAGLAGLTEAFGL